MAISSHSICGTYGKPLFSASVRSIVDIGASNIYDCEPTQLRQLLKARDIAATPKLEKWVEEFCHRSSFDSEGQRINAAYLSELCEVLGIRYVAIDIFEGPHTIVLDLNRDPVPADLDGAFDLVINCGTTEHVLNQLHAFRVIHDLTRVGGQMFHSLPISGHADHGY